MLPKEVFIYEYEDAGQKYLTAVKTITEIPDDQDGVEVGVYKLVAKKKLRLSRELK